MMCKISRCLIGSVVLTDVDAFQFVQSTLPDVVCERTSCFATTCTLRNLIRSFSVSALFRVTRISPSSESIAGLDVASTARHSRLCDVVCSCDFTEVIWKLDVPTVKRPVGARLCDRSYRTSNCFRLGPIIFGRRARPLEIIFLVFQSHSPYRAFFSLPFRFQGSR